MENYTLEISNMNMPNYEAKRLNLPDANLTSSNTKMFCPPGWIITKDVVRHSRWQAQCFSKGKTVSKNFGNRTGCSDREARKYVVTKMWEIHNLEYPHVKKHLILNQISKKIIVFLCKF